jgi:hypothetical protein
MCSHVVIYIYAQPRAHRRVLEDVPTLKHVLIAASSQMCPRSNTCSSPRPRRCAHAQTRAHRRVLADVPTLNHVLIAASSQMCPRSTHHRVFANEPVLVLTHVFLPFCSFTVLVFKSCLYFNFLNIFYVCEYFYHILYRVYNYMIYEICARYYCMNEILFVIKSCFFQELLMRGDEIFVRNGFTCSSFHTKVRCTVA